MKVVIPGGSGHVGTILARVFHARGDEVTVLSRNPSKALWRVAPWDASTLGNWAQHIDGADVVINLAGRSVNCRYSEANKEAIMQSRVASTRAVGQAIREAARPPRVWLQASTATIYAHRYDAPNDEFTGVLGGPQPDTPAAWRFSVDVARAWEMAVTASTTPSTRKVVMRSALILSPDRRGPFEALLSLVRRGLGGRAGSGRQYVSWIHDDDFVRAVDWLIEHKEVAGPVNVGSPHPLPNAEFMRELRRAWNAPVGVPVPKWVLEIGARVLSTETEWILKSRWVVPGVLQRGGFEFHFPEWPEAARDLCRRWRLSLAKKSIP
jgi:uncharacterized protein (TIGR01777 family)